MKIHMHKDDKVVMAGYKQVTEGFDNLDFAEDGEIDLIDARNILSVIPHKEVIRHLQHWKKKLSKNGVLIVGGVDIYGLSRHIVGRNIDLEKIQEVLSQGLFSSVRDMMNLLVSEGFSIRDRTSRDQGFVIEVTKNEN